MFKFKFFLAVCCATLFFVSCNPNDDAINDNPNDSNFVENFGNNVSRDFIGQVVDVDNNPIQNATVTVGGKTVETDINGVFIINNANVYEQFAHIKAVKMGFIDGSRSMVPTTGKNNVKIMLISNASTQSIQSGVASEVTLSNGTKVEFDGSFQDSNGGAYSGTVQVSMFHLKPSDENISALMPGMLYAEDKNGEEKGLETFGMLHVQLTGSGGQKLQIASGHTAEMSVEIDDTQLATAPSTIPLWHFDEEKGYWKEEGSATKQGNKYVGNVSHFSWWNCDIPTNSIIATVTVVNELNAPLANIIVDLVRNNLDFRSGYSDNNGQISGMIPANETLTMNVYDNCGTVIKSTIIGPFSSDTVLPNIVLNTSQFQTSLVTGTLLKCDNSVVTKGYVFMQYENQNRIYYVSNGSFSFDFLNCSSNSTFSLLGIDSENNELSPVINGTFNSSTVNIGDVSACNSIEGNHSLLGLYTVVVTRTDANTSTQVFNNEVLFHDVYNANSPNVYQTTTTGFYTTANTPAQNAGFQFINNNGNLKVPEQNLVNLYTNLVKGIDSNNGIDGTIIDNNSFQISYEITYAAGPRTFTATYTRN